MNAKTLSRFLRVSSPAVFLGLLLAGASPSPSAQAAGVRDLDRDGIHNISDADVDNDGIPNGSDPNVDGGLCISGPLAGKYIGDRLPNDRTPSIPGLPVGRVRKRLKSESLSVSVIIRWQIARWLDMHPSDVPLKTKSDGAPYLNGYDQRLNISWSHAGECECIALSGSHSIGIDAECHGRLGTEPKELTKIIAPESTHALDELTLLSIWTAKEALLKISGRGLHQHDPNNIELPDSIINARTDLVQISKSQGICGERVALVNWTQSLPKPITITLALKRR